MTSFSFDNYQSPAGLPAERQVASGEYHPPAPLRGRWMFEDQIASNVRGTFFLMIFFILILTGVVWLIGHAFFSSPVYTYALAAGAALVTFLTSYYSYYHSDQLVLNMSQARPVTKEEYPVFLNTLEGLTLAAGLPMAPRAYVIDDSAPNAFATGRDPQHAAVAVTTGLLQKLNRYQLEGVLAHELSHVANRDILLSTVAAIMVGTIVLLSDWVMRSLWFGGGRRRDSRDRDGNVNAILMVIAIIAVILAPIIAQLLRLAISRRREYLADANAIKLTRYPEGLAGALSTIAQDHEPLEAANKATAHLFIANPLQDYSGWLNGLFSTHPPIEQRIARLRAM
jgi:heat shock protein HtpX